MNMKNIYILALIFITTFSFSQEDKIETAQKNAVSSMSLVDALASRIPGARKITDRRGNKNIAIRGRQSFKTAGNQVLWEIDGVLYSNPPELNASLVSSHEELRVLVSLIYEDTKELLEGLTAPDTGERRSSALSSFNNNLGSFQQKIEEIISSSTSS